MATQTQLARPAGELHRTYRAQVLGAPMTYGNKSAKINPATGRILLYEQNSRGVHGWQDALRHALRRVAPPTPLNEPVAVDILVILARPASHYGTGKNAGRLKPTAPYWSGVKPDSDKIARAAGDCLTGCWVVDDARIANLHVQKRYADPGEVARTVVEMRRMG